MQQPIYTGAWGNCHIQGIAVDKKQGYIYYSFTTKLIKATLDGEIVGSLDGLVGHLGCIAFNEADGCVYGSLEYKNDSIGKGILGAIGSDAAFEDAFYVARIDVARIDRVGIPADQSDIMKCVYLREVVADYNATVIDGEGREHLHRYGCSGIDGLTFAPLPGKTEEDGMYLYVAYGVYGDETRSDNDHQVILCYDIADWESDLASLDQAAMHRCGPKSPTRKFFVYTGNTRYGVQNLEYDRYTNAVFMAVYRGSKPQFANYDLFAVDWSKAPVKARLAGMEEEGETLSLLPMGQRDGEGQIYGWRFPHGATGLYSFGDGNWLISENRRTDAGQCGYIFQYVWDEKHPFLTKG